ncbi:hypothetical protein [uncultured Desulfovibrio sp.]|uniref:hypothetical protein n=1 Tax=uncultured Desulfovibrio sp. TaxID=167968 RepID=UPI002803BE2D|nr:hypothetical protein [uncultured Desulfovibrio sp.]
MPDFHAQLAAPAKMVAKQLVSSKNSKEKRHEEIDHSQPGEKDIEKPQAEIQKRP